jgi:hypothetical protein
MAALLLRGGVDQRIQGGQDLGAFVRRNARHDRGERPRRRGGDGGQRLAPPFGQGEQRLAPILLIDAFVHPAALDELFGQAAHRALVETQARRQCPLTDGIFQAQHLAAMRVRGRQRPATRRPVLVEQPKPPDELAHPPLQLLAIAIGHGDVSRVMCSTQGLRSASVARATAWRCVRLGGMGLRRAAPLRVSS